MDLRALSNEVILSRTNHLVRRERGMTLRVLDHLIEIERRKLHLEIGYSSMFVYCTQGLGYSESAAWRRIQSARCVAKFPEVRVMLETNDVNLSTLAHVARVLTWENRGALLASIRGCSLAEAKTIVARLEARALPREIVRAVAVKKDSRSSQAGELRLVPVAGGGAPADAGAVAACENNDYCRSGSNPPVARPAASSTERTVPVNIEPRTRLSFTADAAFMSNLDRVRTLAWHRLGANPSLEQVFAITVGAFLEKNDPMRRRERRKQREQKANARAVAIPG